MRTSQSKTAPSCCLLDLLHCPQHALAKACCTCRSVRLFKRTILGSCQDRYSPVSSCSSVSLLPPPNQPHTPSHGHLTCKSVRLSRCTILRSSQDRYSPFSSCSSVSWFNLPTAARRPLRGLLLQGGSSVLAPSQMCNRLRLVICVMGAASVIVLRAQQKCSTPGHLVCLFGVWSVVWTEPLGLMNLLQGKCNTPDRCSNLTLGHTKPHFPAQVSSPEPAMRLSFKDPLPTRQLSI